VGVFMADDLCQIVVPAIHIDCLLSTATFCGIHKRFVALKNSISGSLLWTTLLTV
jgi:hypothetical protein